MNKADAARELLARRKAREGFADFCRYMWPEEPPAKHHELLCDLLDKVIDGEIRRLMVFMPPGCAKSSYSSKRFPAYYLGREPKKAIICGSYDTELSTEFGRHVRNYVGDAKYQNLFTTRLSEDSRAKGQWATDSGATYYACGVGSAVTGRRGDCLTGDTEIITNEGIKRIDEIDIASKSCYVLSYDNRPLFKKILAFASREAEEYLEIHTSSGKMVKATGNHRIFTSEGYKKASNIAEGEVLLSLVPEASDFASLRLSEEGKEKREGILQQFLCVLFAKQRQWQPTEILQGVWNAAKSRLNLLLLRRGLQERSDKKGQEKPNYVKRDRLRSLWHNLSTSFTFNKVLLNGVQECGSCAFDDGGEQPGVAQWDESVKTAASCSENLSDNKTKDHRKGRSLLRRLFESGKTQCSPYQFKSIGQSLDKLGNTLRTLSSKVTRSRKIEAEKDIVSLVKRVHQPTKVYDIQVEETECFFANGVLVHNCGIIDDPVKGQEEADSKTVREKTWKWYKSDFFSRLKPGASQLIIQTRWNEDDLSGRILPDWDGKSGIYKGFDNQEWHVICLPAEAEEDDILGRKKGDWLWDEYYTPEVWEEIKAVQTNNGKDFRVWGALYQQNPQPDDGIHFKREWFEQSRYDLGKEPHIRKYGASDYAVTKDGGDHTEHGVGGFDYDFHLWFVDWWSGQVDSEEWIESQIKLARKHGIYDWISEVGVIRRSVEPFLNRRKKDLLHKGRGQNFKMHWLPHIGDKMAKAKAFQSMAMAGEVHIPRCKWGDDLIDQLVKFIPNANIQDDKVDVCGFFGRILDQVFAPVQVEVEEQQEKDSYGFDEEEGGSWKTA